MLSDKEDQVIHEKISPGFERSIVHLNNLMVVVWDFTNGPKNSPDPPHSHPHEQITYVAEGELLFFKDKKEYHLVQGDLLTVPPDIPHSIQILSNHVKLVDSFHPLREDFLKKD